MSGANHLTPDDQTPRLTRKQAEGLRRIRDLGPMAWCSGGCRAGGAIARMFDRMAEAGLCTPAPHYITNKGQEALGRFYVTK